MTVSIDIPDADYEALAALAKRRGRSIPDLIHRMTQSRTLDASFSGDHEALEQINTGDRPAAKTHGQGRALRRRRLRAMAKLQDELNTKVHPEWREQGHLYYRAIWVECAELLDHHGWKWWTHQEPDFRQIHLELVDIWHFGLSELIRDHGIDDALADRLGAALAAEPDRSPVPDQIETLAVRTLANRSFALEPFAALMRATGLSETDLYRAYLAKNVLNAFRLANGYRSGNYRKQWLDGREDNAHLADLAGDLDPDAKDFTEALQERLASAYRETLEKAADELTPPGRGPSGPGGPRRPLQSA